MQRPGSITDMYAFLSSQFGRRQGLYKALSQRGHSVVVTLDFRILLTQQYEIPMVSLLLSIAESTGFEILPQSLLFPVLIEHAKES